MDGAAFRSFGSTTLYNGKTYSVKTPPYLLVPKEGGVMLDSRLIPTVNQFVEFADKEIALLETNLTDSEPVAIADAK